MAQKRTSQLPAIANPQAVDLVGVDRKGQPFTGLLSTNHVAPMSHVGAGGDQHALATATDPGFFSPEEKIKLAGLSSGAGAVPSVFGRVGAVEASDGDYPASMIANDSDVPGARVKDALNALVPSSRQVLVAGSITGGGALSADVAVALDGDEAAPPARRHYGTNHAGGKTWVPDMPVARAAVGDPTSPYAPPHDGRVVPITITDGRTIVVDKPGAGSAEDIDECVVIVACETMPCVVESGTYDAIDGNPPRWTLRPGETRFMGFYRVRVGPTAGLWTLVGDPDVDDNRLRQVPAGFGLVAPARMDEVVARLHARLAALEAGGAAVAGVTTLNDVAGAVTLTAASPLGLSRNGSELSVGLNQALLQGIAITAGGQTTMRNAFSFQAGTGLAIDSALVPSGIIKFLLTETNEQTPVGNVAALVYASAPNVFGATTAPVEVLPASTPLGSFPQVGDVQVVTVFGNIDFPTSASGSKSPVWAVNVNGTAITLTGGALSATSLGRYYVLTGYLVRTGASTLSSFWHLRFSNNEGAIADGGGWPSSAGSSPFGHALIQGADATVANWQAATFGLSVNWNNDAETKKLYVEAVLIGRLGRDSDTAQAARLFLAAGAPGTTMTQTTATALVPQQTLPANILDKPGAMVEMLIGGTVTSGSATPTFTYDARINGAIATSSAFGSVGSITGQKKALLRVQVYRLDATSARVRAWMVLGSQGTSGSLSSQGTFAHAISDPVITGLDFAAAITLDVMGTWSSATGTPGFTANWFHLRRRSDQLGRAVSTTSVTTTFTTVLDAVVPADAFSADGKGVVLETLSSIARSSGTAYPSWRLTVAGQALTGAQAIGFTTKNYEAVFHIVRVSPTQLRVLAANHLSGLPNMRALPRVTFDPANTVSVKLEVKTTDSSHSITPDFAALSALHGGGELVT